MQTFVKKKKMITIFYEIGKRLTRLTAQDENDQDWGLERSFIHVYTIIALGFDFTVTE